jgi:hypothetical protein
MDPRRALPCRHGRLPHQDRVPCLAGRTSAPGGRRMNVSQPRVRRAGAGGRSDAMCREHAALSGARRPCASRASSRGRARRRAGCGAKRTYRELRPARAPVAAGRSPRGAGIPA